MLLVAAGESIVLRASQRHNDGMDRIVPALASVLVRQFVFWNAASLNLCEAELSVECIFRSNPATDSD